MASSAPASPPRSRRIGLRILAGIGGVLLLLIAALAWLLHTGSGARAALSLLPDNLGRAERVDGRLAGPLTIGRLVLDTEGQRVTLDDLRLDWQPGRLLKRHLQIDLLRVGRIVVETREKKEEPPPTLPERIALPLTVHVERLQVDGGEVRLAPASVVTLGAFHAGLDFDGARYRFTLDGFDAGTASDTVKASGEVSGEATLSAATPYPLSAAFTLKGGGAVAGENVDGAGSLRIGGSLAEMRIEPDLTVNRAALAGSIALRPFSPQPLGAADLRGKAIDLAVLKPGLPRTLLDLALTAGENGDGELTVTNADAGLLDAQKAPLTDLRIAFRQSDERIEIDSLVARLGTPKRPAGAVSGKGSYADGAATLDLSTDALDLQRVDGRIQATKLAGSVALRQSPGRQEITAELTEPLKKQKLALSAHAVLADDVVTVDRARLQLGEGRLDATARIGLADTGAFKAAGRIERFRPRDLGDFKSLPDIFLNGDFDVAGARSPQLTADLKFAIRDSRIAGQPLSGDGDAQLRADSLRVSKLALAAGANRLDVRGQLSESGGELTFRLDAPKLEQLGKGFGGALQADGTARGSFDTPHIDARWTASAVRFGDTLRLDSLQGNAQANIDRKNPLLVATLALDTSARGLRSGDTQVGALSARARFGQAADAPLALTVRAQELQAGGMRAVRVNLDADGTTARHTIDALLAEPEHEWRLGAEGGLSDLLTAPQWQGSIARFDAGGRFTGKLAAPAPLTVSGEQVRLDRFRFDASTGTFDIEQFLRNADGIVTRGAVERLQVAQLLQFVRPDGAPGTTLQLSGDWNLDLTAAPSGRVRLRRDSGDVVAPGNTPVALGLRTLEAVATLDSGRLAVRVDAAGQQLGTIQANGSTVVAKGLELGQNAPLSGTVRIDIPSLAWAGALASPTLLTEGRLQSAVTIAGTVAEPRLAGQINGSGLRVLLADLGVDLRGGVLDSEFQDTRLVLKSLRFGNAAGLLNASGTVDFAGQTAAQIAVRADRFALLDRADRRLRISGDTRIGLRDGAARVDGNFTVDSGFIDIGSTSAPKLSDDVVIVGRTEKDTKDKGKAKKAGGLPATIDVGVSLGDGIALRGRGLDAQLVGDMRIASAAGDPPRARGTLRIAKGTFSAYSRELAIERGVLRFNGPIDNPSLDILAMRRGQEVEAGVAVLGTVLSPRINLVSEPPVPDAEKLSWLVLGRGLEAVGQSELGTLQSAAGALLAQGAAAGVSSQIARTFGLDEVSIGNDRNSSVQERIVTLGKQISSRLYVSFERGLETASSVVNLRYTLSPKLTLEAETGSRSALSLFYNIAFD